MSVDQEKETTKKEPVTSQHNDGTVRPEKEVAAEKQPVRSTKKAAKPVGLPKVIKLSRILKPYFYNGGFFVEVIQNRQGLKYPCTKQFAQKALADKLDSRTSYEFSCEVVDGVITRLTTEPVPNARAQKELLYFERVPNEGEPSHATASTQDATIVLFKVSSTGDVTTLRNKDAVNDSALRDMEAALATLHDRLQTRDVIAGRFPIVDIRKDPAGGLDTYFYVETNVE